MFDWDDANVDHIARHRVTPEEVEEALDDPNRIDVEAPNVAGERRRAVVGRTGEGRLLFVAFTRVAGWIRAITAYDPDPGDQRRYRRQST